jgi:hypothetical protein
MRIIKIKNLQASSDTYCGKTIAAGAYYTLENEAERHMFAADEKVNQDLWADTALVCVNDGEKDLDKRAGDEWLKLIEKRELDGKRLVHDTARPLGTFTYFTGGGDDQTDPHAVGGDENNILSLDLPSGTNSVSKYLDFNIIKNQTHVHEGTLMWKDALNDIIKMELVPKTTDYTSGSNTNYNLYGGYLIIPAAGDGTISVASEDMVLIQCVPNEFGNKPAGYWNADWNETTKEFENIAAAPLGDGEYNMFGLEVVLARFCNWIPILGCGQVVLQSEDQSRIGHGIRLKVTGKTKGDNHAWKCAAFITMHRKYTC